MSIHTSVPRATGLSTFKLSVWTPFVPQTALRTSPAVATPDSTPPAPTDWKEWTEDSSDLLQEVFSWRMLEDAFGGILDPIARARLTALLSEPLAPDRPPRDRSVAPLREFIDAANRLLESGGVDWSDSQNQLSEDDEEEALRLNALLAFVNHLSWLIAVFDDQPNVSVSIR